MPRSVLLGRVVEPGEPLFTDEDTAYAMALAEEEAATCPSCGLLKVICRDPANQFAFEAAEEQCHATYAIASHRKKVEGQRSDEAAAATMTHPKIREGVNIPLDAGLDLTPESDAS